MKCPFCGTPDTTVVETRLHEDGDQLRRRRRCSGCEKRFTTYEKADIQMPQVVKKNGARIEFNRNKLRGSLELALRKRPVSTELLYGAIAEIEEKLLSSGAREVSSHQIGELVMRELKKLDKVAYIRFASVYRNFEDVDAFSQAILEISPSDTLKK